MRKKRFIFNATVLTGTALITQTIGMFFRVYMVNAIGTQGIGLYQLVSSVYLLTVTFCTSGITLAVTRLITETLALKEYKKSKTVIRTCMFIALVLSLIAGTLLYFNAQYIGDNILKDSRTILSLKILAPSLPFLSISACFRGYFYAKRTAIKTATEQLLEQIIEIIIFAAIIGSMADKGLEYACASIAIGATVSEFISCGYSYLMYRIDMIKVSGSEKVEPSMLKKIASIGIPVTLSSCLRTGLFTVENILIISGLKKYGSSYEKSLSDYGTITGLVVPVLAFPAAFLMCFSNLMIPEMSEAKATVRENSINYMTQRIIRFALLFSLPLSMIFFFFANDISMMLYGSEDAGLYMRWLAPIVPLIYLDAVVDGMLKGLNEQMHYLTYNILDSVVKVTLIYFLLPIFGLKALVAIMFLSSILNCTLSLKRLLEVTKLKFKMIEWVFKPLLGIMIPCFVLELLERNGILPQNHICTIAYILISLIIYMIIMILTGAMKKEEVEWIKRTVTLK